MSGGRAGRLFRRTGALAAWLASATLSAAVAPQSGSDLPSGERRLPDADLLSRAIEAQVKAEQQFPERDALDKATIRDSDGAGYLLLEGKDAADKVEGYSDCFERPVTNSFQTANGPIEGFVQYVRMSVAGFSSHAQAIVSVPPAVEAVCFRSRITLGEREFRIRPVYSDVASFWTVNSGPQLVVANEKALAELQEAGPAHGSEALRPPSSDGTWAGILGGLLGGRSSGLISSVVNFRGRTEVNRLIQPEPVAFTSFGEIVREFAPKPRLTMIGLIFGKASERWVGLRISSIPAGATLEVDGKDKQFMTDGITWIAGSSLARARLRYQQSKIPLSQCTVRPASGRVAANLTCTIR